MTSPSKDLLSLLTQRAHQQIGIDWKNTNWSCLAGTIPFLVDSCGTPFWTPKKNRVFSENRALEIIPIIPNPVIHHDISWLSWFNGLVFTGKSENRKPMGFYHEKYGWFSVNFPLNLTMFLSFWDDKARSHGWPCLLQRSYASHHGSCGHVALATEVQ